MAEQKPKQPKQTNKQNNKPKRSPLTWLYYAIMVGLLIFFFFPMGGEKGANKDLSYTKFTAYIDNDAVASVKVYDDNSAEAKIRPESYALVFGNQEAGEDVKGKLNAQVPSVEEFAKYIDNVNITRKEAGKAAIDVSYAKSKDYWYMTISENIHDRPHWHLIKITTGRSDAAPRVYLVGRVPDYLIAIRML